MTAILRVAKTRFGKNVAGKVSAYLKQNPNYPDGSIDVRQYEAEFIAATAKTNQPLAYWLGGITPLIDRAGTEWSVSINSHPVWAQLEQIGEAMEQEIESDK